MSPAWVAYHEAGHAVYWSVVCGEPFYDVSIWPSECALGVVRGVRAQTPQDDPEKYAGLHLAGIVAEQLFFDDVSRGWDADEVGTAWKTLRPSCPDDRSCTTRLKAVWKDTRDALRAPPVWDAVCTLAIQLTHHGSLDYDTAHALAIAAIHNLRRPRPAPYRSLQ